MSQPVELLDGHQLFCQQGKRSNEHYIPNHFWEPAEQYFYLIVPYGLSIPPIRRFQHEWQARAALEPVKMYLGTVINSVQYDSPADFRINNLVHDTSYENAQLIKHFGYFLTAPKRVGRDLLNLSWWSTVFEEKARYGHTAPFTKVSDHGAYRFTSTLEDLTRDYMTSRQRIGTPVFKNLGTFVYIREIMYAIVVCCDG